MLRYLFFPCLSFSTLYAQKPKEQAFDAFFLPTNGGARYYVITEKKGDRWYREAYYLPEKSMAMKGEYSDEKCERSEGEITWYHPNKFLQSIVKYKNGKEEGTAMHFHDNGMMKDSGNYSAGRLMGIRLGWDNAGHLTDSLNFDGAGNGVDVKWFSNGNVASAGRWINDTIKINRWNYYFSTGKLLASEDYVAGKKAVCHCYDENGNELDPALCLREEEAHFPGEEAGWRRFLEKNLSAQVASDNGAPSGLYTIVIQFLVDVDGSLKDLKPLTHFGYGMEAEVIKMLGKSPPWVPAIQFGRNVKAYRKQPVTFVLTEE